MIKFIYTVSYGRRSPDESIDPITDQEVASALTSFHDALRQRLRELDPESAVTITESGLTAIQSMIRPDMIDEVVQRRADRYQLTAKLETVAA